MSGSPTVKLERLGDQDLEDLQPQVTEYHAFEGVDMPGPPRTVGRHDFDIRAMVGLEPDPQWRYSP